MKNNAALFTVGKLAEEAGVNGETIRYYEKQGLMPEPQRSSSGYRIYSSSDLKLLQFIKTSQKAGFTLKEIKELLSLSVRKGDACTLVHQRAQVKLDIINQKIAELERMKKALTDFSGKCCGSHTMEDCHLVHSLWGEEGECDGTHTTAQGSSSRRPS